MNALRSSASCQVAPATASSISFFRHTCEAGLYQQKSRIKQSGCAQGSNDILLSAPPRLQEGSRAGRGRMEASAAPQREGILRATLVLSRQPLPSGCGTTRARRGLGKPCGPLPWQRAAVPPRGGCHGTRPEVLPVSGGAGAAGSGAAWRPTSFSAAWVPGLALTCGASGWTRGASGCGDTEGRARGSAPARFRLRSLVLSPSAALRSGARPWRLTLFPVLPQVVKENRGSVSLESLDFFGKKEGAPQGSAEEGWGLAGAEKEVKQQEDGAGKNDGKRKRTAESSEGKRKKKKTRGICTHTLVSLAESSKNPRMV